jgi:hypothetical protein
MDPVTIGAVLLAIASGASGEVGKQLWDGLVALVRRPLHRRSDERAAAELVPTGGAQLTAFQQARGDRDKAVALAEALVDRSGADAEFRQALESWWRQAEPIRAGTGNVTNTITGGTQHGPVLQARTVTGVITLSTAAPPPAVPPPYSPSPRDDP